MAGESLNTNNNNSNKKRNFEFSCENSLVQEAAKNPDLIAKIMEQTGPIVKTVVLRLNGTIEELEMDLSPSKNEIYKFFDDNTATFVGQFTELNVVVLKRIDSFGLKLNQHKLQYPLNNIKDKIYGDMLCIRMNENAMPLDFTIDEYKKYVERDLSSFEQKNVNNVNGTSHKDIDQNKRPKLDNSHGLEEIKVCESSSSSSDVIENGASDSIEQKQEMIMAKICEAFKEHNGREPSVEEMKDVLRKLTDSHYGFDEDNSEEDDDYQPGSSSEEEQNENELDEDLVNEVADTENAKKEDVQKEDDVDQNTESLFEKNK